MLSQLNSAGLVRRVGNGLVGVVDCRVGVFLAIVMLRCHRVVHFFECFLLIMTGCGILIVLLVIDITINKYL